MKRIGERWLSNEKHWMTIISSRGSLDCDIQFEDGIIVKNLQYANIKRGSVLKPIDHVGERHFTNEGYVSTIIECETRSICTIQLNDDRKTILKNVRYSHIQDGEIKNPFHIFIFGVGFMGVGKHKTKINNILSKKYSTWYRLLERSYSEEYQVNKPTYKNCEAIESWHCFQDFGDWFEENFKPEYMQNWEIDKDILIKGNKLYSPKTCCLVPREINTLFIKADKIRGEYPIGVYKKGNKFKSQISIRGINTPLGTFDTIDEAFEAYKIAKEDYIKELANKYRGQITEECYQALMNYKVDYTD